MCASSSVRTIPNCVLLLIVLSVMFSCFPPRFFKRPSSALHDLTESFQIDDFDGTMKYFSSSSFAWAVGRRPLSKWQDLREVQLYFDLLGPSEILVLPFRSLERSSGWKHLASLITYPVVLAIIETDACPLHSSQIRSLIASPKVLHAYVVNFDVDRAVATDIKRKVSPLPIGVQRRYVLLV